MNDKKLEFLRMSPERECDAPARHAIVKSTLTEEQKNVTSQRQCILHMQKGKRFLISERGKNSRRWKKRERDKA